MPNSLITQQVGPVSRQSLGLLHEQILLPSLMYFDTGVDGGIARGDTVNVRTPATFTAKEFVRATGIELQDITEGSIPVVLDSILDVSVTLTSEELTLDLTDFGRQVTDPAMVALAEGAENKCVALLDQITSQVAVGDDPVGAINTAAGVLNGRRVPKGRRVTVLGTNLATALRNTANLREVDKAGNSEALRDAMITRLGGSTIYESSYVDPDTGWMFAPEAFVFVTRALETIGSSQVSSATFEGISLRTAMDYDITKKSSIASWDFLNGGKVLSQARAVKIGATNVPLAKNAGGGNAEPKDAPAGP